MPSVHMLSLSSQRHDLLSASERLSASSVSSVLRAAPFARLDLATFASTFAFAFSSNITFALTGAGAGRRRWLNNFLVGLLLFTVL